MKNFLIALLLTSGLVVANIFIKEIIYIQIISFVWLVGYALGLNKLEGQFINEKNELATGKWLWNGLVCRTLPLTIYINVMIEQMWNVEFLFSLLMFLLVGCFLIARILIETANYIDFDEE